VSRSATRTTWNFMLLETKELGGTCRASSLSNGQKKTGVSTMKDEMQEVLRNLFMSEMYRCELPANYTSKVVQDFDWADMAERVIKYVEKI
jgi:hypothetical protein